MFFLRSLGVDFQKTWIIKGSLDDHLTNHACAAMGLTVVVIGSSIVEGFLPGFSGCKGEVGMAVFVMAFKDSIVRSHLVVNELDGVTGFDGDGARFESEHAGIGTELHFNGGGVGCSHAKGAGQHECDGRTENGLQTLQHVVSKS